MIRTFLRAKIHRAVVTSTDVDYEGSISIDPEICAASGLLEFEQVDVYDITNGARLTTYVIYGEPRQFQINGAAARLVNAGDLIIVAAYCALSPEEIAGHVPVVVHMDKSNRQVFPGAVSPEASGPGRV